MLGPGSYILARVYIWHFKVSASFKIIKDVVGNEVWTQPQLTEKKDFSTSAKEDNMQ